MFKYWRLALLQFYFHWQVHSYILWHWLSQRESLLHFESKYSNVKSICIIWSHFWIISLSPFSKGILFTTATWGRHFLGRKTTPFWLFIFPECVFLLSRLSLVAANKAFFCGLVSAIADTVSVRGVPVPGPNPQTNSREGQGQPLPLLSLGTIAAELYLKLQLDSSRPHVSVFIFQRSI